MLDTEAELRTFNLPFVMNAVFSVLAKKIKKAYIFERLLSKQKIRTWVYVAPNVLSFWEFLLLPCLMVGERKEKLWLLVA